MFNMANMEMSKDYFGVCEKQVGQSRVAGENIWFNFEESVNEVRPVLLPFS